MSTFGPVPSRRLGNSLGLNNIPHKICPYSCVYCQVGRTRSFNIHRRDFFDSDALVSEAGHKIRVAEDRGERIDYLSFVPDGEPTLDLNLGRTIGQLKRFGVKIAVISNAALITELEVRRDLEQADWVSLKFDSVVEPVWKKVNRPRSGLRISDIMKGAMTFAETFSGTLVTETMLVDGLNDNETGIRETAKYIARLEPSRAYLSIPTRPPAERWVAPPSDVALGRAFGIFSEHVTSTEYLVGYEGNAFSATGDAQEDLLAITSVHPMRVDAVQVLLDKTGSGWPTVESMIDRGLLSKVAYGDQIFYLRTFPVRNK
jgi:wyosine [tRNA(Phe)-imidazoG37] synthetase (radical SAM superfamily)